jgi:hypothetical protein
MEKAEDKKLKEREKARERSLKKAEGRRRRRGGHENVSLKSLEEEEDIYIYRSREIAGREDERMRRQGRETDKTVTAVNWRKRKDKKRRERIRNRFR